MRRKGIFITGTDTDIGKTVSTYVLGALAQKQGMDVGIMKPVQCAGDDAEFLKKQLNIPDDINEINPYFAPEPLSPHLAFSRAGKRISIPRIIKIYQELQNRHEFMLVEGAGGLLVPINKNILVADLIKELELDVLIITRPGLGTINHTLMTIKQAKDYGLNVCGVLVCNAKKVKNGLAEKDNPHAIEKFGKVPIIGEVPYLTNMQKDKVIKVCQKKINVNTIWGQSKAFNNRIQDIAKWDKQYLWHPFTQMQDWLNEEPLVVDRAQGVYLTDTKNRKYIDGNASLWVNVHGHNHSHINALVKDQVNRLSHSTLLGLTNVPAVQLAKKLIDITPKGLEKVFYSDNGSTSVEIAVKMAYQYWQNIGKPKKRNIMHLANSYHGDTLGSVSVGGIDLFHKVYRDLMFETIQIDFPDCYRAPKDKKYPQYAFEFVKKFEKTLKEKHATTAAFIVEPLVQGAAGIIVWPKGVLKQMRELCIKYDVLFVADEVATGFGRTGTMFACQQENVTPDILCLAKGLTGGYLPLAATITTQKLFDGFCFDYKDQKTFFHGHTYTGNPVCCAAALANLEVFEKERVMTKLQPKIKYLSQELEMFYNLAHVGDVRQKGFMVGIELVEEKDTKKPFDWAQKIGVKVCAKAREQGIIIRPLGNVIVLMPALSATKQELSQLLKATYWSIKETTEND